MSLDHQSALIEQLIPLLQEDNFTELFETITANTSNSNRFLLKMELNRLNTPCARILDLRDKSELPCSEVLIGEQRHFLDEPAKKHLQEALALYGNKYTLGVYENILAHHQLRRQSANPTIEPSYFTIPGVILGHYVNRSEERMNYSIRISASQTGRGEINGITTDLSISGARIRLPINHPFQLSEPLTVKLLELNEEYYYADLKLGVEYEIVDSQNNDEFIWLRLKRISGTESLSNMISELIKDYKLRYKVDVNDVVLTATALGFERNYLPHMPHLPLYFNQQKSSVEFMLLSRDNQQIMHYFQDENNVSQLPAMLTKVRLAALITQPENADHGLFFSFTYNAQGSLYFYSATLAELKANAMMPLFLGFASTKPSWRIFKLVHDPIYHQKGYRRASIPGDEDKYSPDVEKQLSELTHLLQLIDLTNEDERALYKAWQDNSNVNALKTFGQKRLTHNHIRLISMQFSERRQETRFVFKTLVTVSQNGLSCSAMTLDISSHGLQLTLDEPTDFSPNKPVSLSFPKLQAIAGRTQLKKLPYHLIRIRKNGVTLHLKAVVSHSPHVGVQFLNKLIAHNKEKLEKLTENNSETKELADGLKNLVLHDLHSVPYFIEKTQKSAKMSCLGVNTKPDEISHLFAAGTAELQQYNLTPLLENGFFRQEILRPMRRMNAQQEMDFVEVFIHLTRQPGGKVSLICMRAADLVTKYDKVAFITKSKQTGHFIALRVYRGVTEKPDIGYVSRELEYIYVHAHHKAKLLEERLWRIIGVGELLDITQEVELRYPELHQITSSA